MTTAAPATPDAAFLDAILAHPDEDWPRLQYADWMEENAGDAGQTQAAFIRVRVEWEQLPDCGHDWSTLPGGWKCPTCRRKDELYATHVGEDGFPPWERAMRGWARPFKLSEVTFRRGFIEKVECSCVKWLARGPALIRAAPLRGVTLIDREPARVLGTRASPGGWYWFLSDFGLAPHHLPRCLWKRMGKRDTSQRRYRTEALALADLSRASLEWARLPADQR